MTRWGVLQRGVPIRPPPSAGIPFGPSERLADYVCPSAPTPFPSKPRRFDSTDGRPVLHPAPQLDPLREAGVAHGWPLGG